MNHRIWAYNKFSSSLSVTIFGCHTQAVLWKYLLNFTVTLRAGTPVQKASKIYSTVAKTKNLNLTNHPSNPYLKFPPKLLVMTRNYDRIEFKLFDTRYFKKKVTNLTFIKWIFIDAISLEYSRNSLDYKLL